MYNDYPQEAARAALAAAVASADPAEITKALIAVVNGDPDWSWLEERCLALLSHPNVDVRGLAATSLGHIARLHGQLHAQAIRRLQEAHRDPLITGRVDDALADIDTYLIDGAIEG